MIGGWNEQRVVRSATAPGSEQKQFKYAQVAQSVEQRIENPRVGGSIPPLGTITKFPKLQNRP